MQPPFFEALSHHQNSLKEEEKNLREKEKVASEES